MQTLGIPSGRPDRRRPCCRAKTVPALSCALTGRHRHLAFWGLASCLWGACRQSWGYRATDDRPLYTTQLGKDKRRLASPPLEARTSCLRQYQGYLRPTLAARIWPRSARVPSARKRSHLRPTADVESWTSSDTSYTQSMHSLRPRAWMGLFQGCSSEEPSRLRRTRAVRSSSNVLQVRARKGLADAFKGRTNEELALLTRS